MKRFWSRSVWAAAVLAGAGSLAVVAPTVAASVNPVTGHETVRGIVTSLADDSLTVDNHEIIAISAATACTHSGQTMMISDLEVGDRVSVELFRDPANGRQQAISIEVISQAHGGAA